MNRASALGEPPTTFLCSGFGLGFYIPGVLIREKLEGLGCSVRLEVFESLLSAAKLDMVEKSRRAYRENFAVALASQRVPSDIRNSLDDDVVENLLDVWQRAGCRRFVCMSGHWVHVLDRYRDRVAGVIDVDLLYLDADLAPSWRQLRKVKADYAKPYREVRLYDLQQMDIIRYIDANMPALDWASRNGRLVVHGGGWGLGTFESSIDDLEDAEYALDIVCYEQSQDALRTAGRRLFLDDPSWRTWHRDLRGELGFPPFGEASIATPTQFEASEGCHGLHRVVRQAAAIVSKPGAGTLIDSFASATPLIMLETFGPHEACNAKVWEACGFGLYYADWAAGGFKRADLETLHQNLIRRRHSIPDYGLELAEVSLPT